MDDEGDDNGKLTGWAVAAPPGWRAMGKETGGGVWIEPVVAWVIYEHGEGYPVVPNRGDGVVEIMTRGVELLAPGEPDPPEEATPGAAGK
ncbi:MAG: hypothetical protein J2P19_03855 [Pseudonocardia sp.]|nr:hypothetical protein [Pseudonocardia sp.]